VLLGTTQSLKLLPLVVPQEQERTPTVSMHYNAQAVYTKLVRQATMSRKAKLSCDKLVIELTTLLLDSTWRGTHEGFVLMWKEKMSLLEDVVTSSQYHYADEVKLSMLQNAVSLVSKQNQIRDISNNLVAVGSLPRGNQPRQRSITR